MRGIQQGICCKGLTVGRYTVGPQLKIMGVFLMTRFDDSMTICGARDAAMALELVQGLTEDERRELIRMLTKQYGMRVVRGVPD